VVRHLQGDNPNILYRQLPVNVGPYVAKTLGVELASGPFVTCHDCDDWSHPCKIATQVEPLLRHRGLVATASRWVRLDDGGRAYARSTYPLLRLNPSSILFRKAEVLEKAGLWDCSRTGSDSEFLARLKAVFGRGRVRMVGAPLAFGAHRSDSLMTASSTGMGTGAMHPDRLAYWQAWSGWHIDALASGEALRMPTLSAERPFQVPGALRNAPETIDTCLAWWQRNSDLTE
jgi:glycosyltransferase involved in cell wall biosynthesis